MLNYISLLHSALDLPDQGRSLVIMGSTGSIGASALKVVREHPDMFQVVGLAAGDNVQLLAEQAAELRPRVLALRSQDMIPGLQRLLPEGYQPQLLHGQQGYVQLAGLPEAELILSAQVGAAGLASTLEAAQQGKVIALANKESLVLAGGLLRKACAVSGAAILPVDSEHNALFQALQGQDWSEASRLLLTASGGPFLGWSRQQLAGVTREQALKHPNWSMGAKISIDSATMMNKGLEVIEACHLFGVGPEDIQVLVHPESIVHSLVQYQDGSVLAQMGIADMCIPIGFCLSYPHRLVLGLKPLDLVQVGSLSFRRPDPEAFPCLELAKQALAAGPSHPAALNAANEVAVQAFLENRIGFMDIARLNQEALEKHQGVDIGSLEDVLEVDRLTREFVWDRLQSWS
ncbi:MAG: 1-deoxy-D-xylulose-5-phosphate reductoisomerase [Desulfohalobiaceae bacterium]